MTLHRLVAVALGCLLLTGVPLRAQLTPEMIHDQAIAAEKPASAAAHQLAVDLCLARRSGNAARVQELESRLFTSVQSLPGEGFPAFRAGEDREPLQKTMAPTWGNDVKIYAGQMYTYGKRQICIDADTLGGIYVALNARWQDSLSIVRIYKSTDGGSNWSFLFSFYSPGLAIQSFDMCVTDTTGGKFILGFALVVKTDKTAGGGGVLWWTSVLNDGTHFRSAIIGHTSSALAFKNPAICTDGTYYSSAFFYVAAEYTNPANDATRGLWVTRSIDWGKTWAPPDTSIRGFAEATPVIAIDWSTNPDSLCLAFTRFATPNREIRVARTSLTIPGVWAITYPGSPKDEYDPSLALDPVRGNGIITYTRATGAPTYNDAMYFRSTDLFRTFTRDSIATSTASEEFTSASYAPWGTGYYWRTAYRSSAGGDTIYYKAMNNTMSAFHATAPRAVSQYRPTGSLIPVVGYDRDPGGTSYRGNVLYVGFGPQDVFFDAVDLALDVEIPEGVPDHYVLEQNFPNPFNPSTTIRYSLPHAGPVRLVVYNALGQQVAELVNAMQEPGYHTVQFNGAVLSSGVYFYRLETGDFREARKLILMK
jgi:hypothetical protein